MASEYIVFGLYGHVPLSEYTRACPRAYQVRGMAGETDKCAICHYVPVIDCVPRGCVRAGGRLADVGHDRETPLCIHPGRIRDRHFIRMRHRAGVLLPMIHQGLQFALQTTKRSDHVLVTVTLHETWSLTSQENTQPPAPSAGCQVIDHQRAVPYVRNSGPRFSSRSEAASDR